MGSLIKSRPAAAFLVLLSTALGVAAATAAADEPPFEFDPALTLSGTCSTTSFDPVLDPSCSGEPPTYPAPPNGPSGQFTEPRAITVDGAGNEYVASFAAGDDGKGRVDVFDDEGHFITEVAVKDPKSIAVDSKGNLYVFEIGGNVVRYPAKEYEAEAGVIEYGEPPVTVSAAANNGALAVDRSPLNLDQLLVLASGVVTRYSSAANGNEVIDSFTVPGAFANSLAIDSQVRRLFASYCKNGNEDCVIGVFAADAPHTLLKEIDGTPNGKFISDTGALGVAVDEESGDFFVLDLVPAAKSVFQYDKDYEFLSGFTSDLLEASETINVQIAVSNGTTSSEEPCKYPTPAIAKVPPGDACNRHYLFVPRFRKTGSALAYRPANQAKPVIEGVSTAGIGETEAELRATIDPRGLETEYHFELTTQEAFEAEGFEGAAILAGGTVSADSLASEVGVFATGLVQGQAYRFRAVASNELGVAPEEGQNEATFATYDDAGIPPAASCPNEGLRLGRSALLPDCRAYELVTPADTLGRSPKGMAQSAFTVLQAAPAGDAVSFRIEGGSLPGTSGAASFFGDPYLSRRGDSGWVTELAGPSGEEAPVMTPGGFSADQRYSYWIARVEGPLVVEGQQTHYLRYPDGHSEMLGVGSLGFDAVARTLFISGNGTHVIFNASKKLEPDAPPTGTAAIYDRTIDPGTGEEEVHVVSLLPGDVTPEAGEGAEPLDKSADGEGMAFEIGGTVYLRVGNKATYEIGDNIEVAGVSEGGGRIFYFEGGDLKAFDVSSEEIIAFTNTGDVTPVNVATGGTRVAFVSPSVLDGANPEGAVAQAGKQNLYLSEEGAISFVATVTDRDVKGDPPGVDDGLGLWMGVGSAFAKDPSRFNPDGSVLLFQSRANLTGYPASEFPQLYRYDSAAKALHCISCIPTKTPATGGASLQSYAPSPFAPEPFAPNSFVPNLTPDGKRVFFESTEALVAADTDEVMDVYEWEGQGIGSCKEPEGCVYLISSGASERNNYLYGHSTDGRDVFFTTGDTLTGWDSPDGAVSIYDARVNGGYPEPTPPEDCVGDGCRPQVTPAPDFGKPEAGGEGNVPPKPKRCPKGKRKVNKSGKVRCVKKKQHKKHKAKGGKARQRAGANRGAAQ